MPILKCTKCGEDWILNGKVKEPFVCKDCEEPKTHAGRIIKGGHK